MMDLDLRACLIVLWSLLAIGCIDVLRVTYKLLMKMWVP